MTAALWALPVLAVVGLIGSGRGTLGAGACGAALALAVALAAAPLPFGVAEAALAVARGAWLAWLVALVILGGLFFREAVASGSVAAAGTRRGRLFTACFLAGPFTECATGFGVGQVATAGAMQALGVAPGHALVLGLFSQTLVPWGALAIGTVVGAELSGVPAALLGRNCAILTAPLLLAWLTLFWRMAAAAGVPGTVRDHAGEAAWLLAVAGLLVGSNILLGLEVAGLAALGPLVLLRFAAGRPDRAGWRAGVRAGLPYAALTLGLALSRGVPAVRDLLGAVAPRPVPGGPAWAVLLHPGTWLAMTALAFSRPGRWGPAARGAWARGRTPALAILAFLVLAQVMLDAGIAAALSGRLVAGLGPAAALATPLLAWLFGAMTSSGNAANGLLMPGQAALAGAAGLSLPWLAAVQCVSAGAGTMLSPVRVAMGCALVGQARGERAVYARAWPLGAAALGVMLAAAVWVAW